jgi:1-acyl-sn-glycerol-3-phosphate acyltransferase
MFYRVFRLLARAALHVFFRRFEVEGEMPERGPLLLVANHSNALVDPLLPMIAMRRRMTITAKSVLGTNPLLRVLMWGLDVVSFHRAEDADKGAEPGENTGALRRCRKILAGGGAICVFPEGRSHSAPGMRPFRKGAARIALDYLVQDGNPGRLKIVPVGLLYTEKHRFRSSVWLRFGRPIDVERWLVEHPQAGTSELTAEMRRRIESLVLQHETRRESLVLTWAAEILRTGGEMPRPLGQDADSVADWFRLIGALQAGYRALLHAHPDVVKTLSARVRRYRTQLRRGGIAPHEVYLPLHTGRAALFVLREVELLVVGAPLALLGALFHLPAYLAVRALARALSRDRDQWASNVVYPSLVLFPLTCVAEMALALALLPIGFALLVTLLVPYTGLVALLYAERTGSALRRTQTFLRFWAEPVTQETLAREGREIVAAIRTLATHLRELPTGAEPPAFAPTVTPLDAQLRADAATLRDLLPRAEAIADELATLGHSRAPQQRGYFTPDEDDRIRQLLLAFRNYRLALWEVISHAMPYARLEDPPLRLRAFLLGFAAGLTTYEKCLKLIEAGEAAPLLRAKLNEPDLKFGLPAGFFEEILEANTAWRNHRLLAHAGRFWRQHAASVASLGVDADPDYAWLPAVIEARRAAVRQTMRTLFLRRLHYNVAALWRSASDGLGSLLYGCEAFFGARLADMWNPGEHVHALGAAALGELRGALQPGDLLLVRAEAKVTAAILPGFWSHVAIYLDGPGALEALGVRRQPNAARCWDLIPKRDATLEAVSSGVSLRTLQACARGDHALVLRPNLSVDGRRAALIEALGHLGKPYDFEFDFGTTSRIVCTELVYRSYHGRGALEFPLVRRLGRYTLTSDDIVGLLLTADGEGRTLPFEVAWLGLRLADGRLHVIRDVERLPWLRAIQRGLRPTSVQDTPPDAEPRLAALPVAQSPA